MKTSNRAHQQGFSVIEIAIITTLVGIIASLAVPAYQTYSIRTQVSEGISLASTLQEQVAYHYTVNGQFPGSNSALDISESGEEFETKTIDSASIGANGVITISFNGLGASTSDKDTLKFIPSATNGSVSWNCDAETATGTLPDQYAPVVCRGTD